MSYNRERSDLFCQILEKVKDGTTITFTKENIAYGDTFLILGHGYDSCTVTFKRTGLIWIYFDNDEPMLLENCPTSFFRSILKNL